MNDETNAVDPVELSPTRAELIERVRGRGRQIRARRKLAMTGVTALVVLAIAAPAIAIGARSSSHSITPATVARTNGDFRIAVVLSATPDTVATAGSCAGLADDKYCYVLGRTLVTARDVQNDSVVYDETQGWLVNVSLSVAGAHRLADPAGQQVAIIVGGRVVSAPVIQTGITGHTVEVVETGLTRQQAVALATKITGRPPTHVDAAPPALSTRIDLGGLDANAVTIDTGRQVHGALIVENNTGKPITLDPPGACEGKWAVTLTGPGLSGDVPWTTECSLGRRVLPPGESTYPISLSTTYTECTNNLAKAPPGSRLCLPGGGIPPLPPGKYYAVLVTSSPGYLPNAPAVQVTLVAAP